MEFLDFLVEKFSRTELVGKAYKTDKEMIEHFLSGEVTIPISDVLKYVEEYTSRYLSSKHQIDDKVMVTLGDRPFKAKVISVHFYRGKVKYDLEIPIYDEESTRIYNIDSVFVSANI